MQPVSDVVPHLSENGLDLLTVSSSEQTQVLEIFILSIKRTLQNAYM